MKKFTLAIAVLTVLALDAQTPIYTQNFSTAGLPAGWQNVDQSGVGGGTWTRKTSAHSFASSTAANGFYIFDSDALGNDSKAENADLITGAIDCSSNTHVALQFQQYFVQYASSSGTVSVSTDGSSWSQVYQVTANSDNPETVTLDITGIAAGHSTVYIKFNYQGNYDYWWAIDDINVYEPAALDIAVDKLTLTKYVGLSYQFVSGVLSNQGSNTITSFDLTYTVNGGGTVSQSFTGVNIPAFGTYPFQFSQPIAMNVAQLYSINVTASGPNSGVDANLANNAKAGDMVALSAIPDKNVMIEEFTTVPCGYCPGGATRINQIEASEGSKAIACALHAGFGTDGMTITEHSTLATAFTSAAPTACIDRVYYDGEDDVAIGVQGMGTNSNSWLDATQEREGAIEPATVACTNTYDANTRQLNVTVTAKFFAAISGDFRVNCYIVEDSVVGSGSGYDQHSYYYTSPTTLNPWLGVGTTNLGSGTWAIAGYVHNHLVRNFMGGAWGSTGIVPATTADGAEYAKSYSYTLPAGWNANHVHLVAFVHEYNSNAKSGKNEILNSIEVPLNGTVTQGSTPSQFPSAINEVKNVDNISLFPNPASNAVNIDYSVNNDSKLSFEVYNVLGQNVYSVTPANFGKGNFRTTINTSTFDNGVYFVTVKDNNKTVSTLRFVVSK